MSIASLLGTQWAGYGRSHQSRRNLLLHIVFVPLFLASNVTVLVALAERRWLWALAAAALTGVAFAIQGLGHAGESVPPEPFTSPSNALSRIFLEQWVTFPRFVLSGAWMRALVYASLPTTSSAATAVVASTACGGAPLAANVSAMKNL